MMQFLFGAPKTAAQSSTTAATTATDADARMKLIQGLKSQIDDITKRKANLTARAEQQKREAIALKDRNKKEALNKMRAYKRLEREADKLDGMIDNLDALSLTLEGAAQTKTTFDAIKSTNEFLNSTKAQMDVNAVDDVRSQLEEHTADLDEIGDALSQPLGSGVGDSDELLAELEELAAANDVDTVVGGPVHVSPAVIAGAGAVTTAVTMPDLPAVPTQPLPTTAVAPVSHPDLAALEASLG